jgi:8-oxo-dGTP diphosphatase
LYQRNSAKSVDDIDWGHWRPVDPATLVFVLRGADILLIRKKRGLGAGKINGPGGRLEAGETPVEAAVREMEEELLVRPTGLLLAGENSFQFVDGYSIHVHVFSATGFEGEPAETSEATPLWFPQSAIPFAEMWEDDHLWVPHLLAGRWFRGRFIFDGDRMLDAQVVVGEEARETTL